MVGVGARGNIHWGNGEQGGYMLYEHFCVRALKYCKLSRGEFINEDVIIKHLKKSQQCWNFRTIYEG